MEWLASRGAHIYVPVGHSPDVDLVAEIDGVVLRVEVKTSTHRATTTRWHAFSIATRGGNQSWTDVSKYFDPEPVRLPVRPRRRWTTLVHSVRRDSTDDRAIRSADRSTPSSRSSAGRPLERDSVEPVLESAAPPGEYRSGQTGRRCKSPWLSLRRFESSLPHLVTATGQADELRAQAGSERRSGDQPEASADDPAAAVLRGRLRERRSASEFEADRATDGSLARADSSSPTGPKAPRRLAQAAQALRLGQAP